MNANACPDDATARGTLRVRATGAELSVLVPGASSWLKRVKYFYMEAHAWAPNPDGTNAAITSVRALLSANMTLVTSLNLKMNTWIPSMPPKREFIYLACHQHVSPSTCRRLCSMWRNGTNLSCDYVRSESEYRRRTL